MVKARYKVFFLLGVIVITVGLISSVLYLQDRERQVLKTKMHLIVGDNPGFDTNNDYVVFGRVPFGGASTRHINLYNINQTRRVYISASGKLADWVSVTENNFIIGPEEAINIDVTASVPMDAEKGDYTGTLVMEFLEIEDG